MKGECFSYLISTKVKPNDHPLTNYSHFNDPTPQMHIRTKKKNVFFLLFFLIDTCLMINFIIKIDTDRKYESRALIWYPNCAAGTAGVVICVKILSGNL